MRKIPAPALIALVLGTVLRASTLSFPGASDVDAWKAWSYYATTRGVAHVYGDRVPPARHIFRFGDIQASVNYPPLAVNELALVGHVYQWAMDGDFANTPALTRAIKVAILLIDVVLVVILTIAVHWIGGRQAAWWAAAAFWINPAAILTSALGYIDVWTAAPAVGALVAAVFGAPMAAGALLAASVLTKPQAVLIAPVVVLALWNADRTTARDRLVAAVAAGTLMTIVVVAPIFAAGATLNMLRAVGSMTRDHFLSGNACNLWWIAGAALQRTWTAPVEAAILPDVPAFGAVDARLIGLMLTAVVSLWALWTHRHARDLGLLAAVGGFLVHAYFTLSTQVHENHFFLAIPFLVIAASLRVQFARVLAVLSVIFALNLYLFYGISGNGPAPLARTVTIIDATLLLAVANCAALAWFAITLARASR